MGASKQRHEAPPKYCPLWGGDPKQKYEASGES